MATFTWKVYANTPAWFDAGSNHIIFSGSSTDPTVPITLNTWNTGTHLGSADPGTDQCGTTHIPNVAYVATNSYSYNGGASTALTDANLLDTHCQLQVLFTDAASVATSNGFFYCYDSTTTTTEATGVEVYAFERGVSATQWTAINDDSANVGGNNSGERLSLGNQTSATEHTYFIAISARPETVGGKGDFEFGVTLTYS